MNARELNTSVVLVLAVLLSAIPTVEAVVVFESFDSDPCWPYQGFSAPYVPIDYWGGPEFVTYDSRSMMKIQPTDTDSVRVRTPFALEGDFTVMVDGVTDGDAGAETHMRHYVGVWRKMLKRGPAGAPKWGPPKPQIIASCETLSIPFLPSAEQATSDKLLIHHWLDLPALWHSYPGWTLDDSFPLQSQ